MPTTSTYGWPYPASGDSPDVPADVRDLAEAIESTVAGLDTGYRYSQTVQFTSSGTFVKTNYSGLRAIRVRAMGAGGGGGGAGATAASEASGGGGGNAGVLAETWVLAASLSASETVTIGAAGAGGVGGSSGSTGGTTSLGTHAVAVGGTGGYSQGAAGTPMVSGSRAPTSTSTSTGDVLVPGQPGAPAILQATNISSKVTGGSGGGSRYGAGGQGERTVAGGAAAGYGAGGGGASRLASSTAVNGGDGSPGLVLIDIYV